MGIKQHLVALTGVRNQPERATCAQLHMGDLDTSKQATVQQPSYGSSQTERPHRGKVIGTKATYRLALLARQERNKRRELAVTAVITLGLDLLKKCLGAPTVVFWPERISLERLL
uniref:Insertion element IS53 DNA sequence n=1 Tax=Pseudomonas syringae TaxID=317 RepID=Q52514_PSESX|nr:ORF3 [Pseudomonas savastanoi]